MFHSDLLISGPWIQIIYEEEFLDRAQIEATIDIIDIELEKA
jgi:hypothetical protein